MTGDYQHFAGPGTFTIKGQRGTGKKGDYLRNVILIPTAIPPGVASLKDGSEASVVLLGGLTAGIPGFMNETKPIPYPVKRRSRSGAWELTLAAGLDAFVTGEFQGAG